LNDRIVQPRRRLVNFRLTEDEYQQLRQASLAPGSRGLSDFARRATLDSARHLRLVDSSADALPQPDIWVDECVNSFTSSLRKLLEAINSMAGRAREVRPRPIVDPPCEG
jgi:hypothetical protein